jgi:adenylate cyclase
VYLKFNVGLNKLIPKGGIFMDNRQDTSSKRVARNWLGNLYCRLSRKTPWFVGAVAAVATTAFGQLGVWEPLENLGSNFLFQVRETGVLPNPGWDERIVTIEIDESSLERYGQFQSWSRDRYIQLLDSLSTASPAVIGFDLLFADPSGSDRAFAAAIEQAGTVVLARSWNSDPQRLEPVEPVQVLSDAASNQGHILHKTEADGITRQVSLWVNGPRFSIPNFGLGMVEVYNAYFQYLGQPVAVPDLPQPDRTQHLQWAWLNWPGKTDAIARYSFADVVEGKVNPRKFKDKLVLVGMTATGADPLRTPLNTEPPTSGVYLHAAVIDNLLNDRFLYRLPPRWTILLLLGVGGVTSSLMLGRRTRNQLGLTVILPLVWLVIAAGFLGFAHLWLPVAAPIVTILLAFVGSQLREPLEKQQLMSLFARYVAPQTANLIWEHKDDFFQKGSLEATEMMATVLFMDIRGFTSISEQMPPCELFEWLNRYLETMSDCIMEEGGTIDKYIGDAIMAVFGVPVAHTDPEEIRQDALSAIAASISIHERLAQLNEELKSHCWPPIRIGVGIHTGSVMAGNLGGNQRLNYSVVGDTVNVAARLESLNKTIEFDRPYQILISSSTRDRVCDIYRTKPATTLRLRGRKQATGVYTILGSARSLSDTPNLSFMPTQPVQIC